ncbi:hypothetical protein HGA11_15310 [Mycolicibacterium septicum DSM 44393]|uniref:PE-PPE domain-containing protein n=1 Tax=Mycolicibacterium septicum DSM 44393 TaxID=1341646 RepID=A0A7X6MP65_9MYCO|nr:hypothetical protein [Mycolicibacterium septicum]NKZ12347.1 hypothetical protein [Mycolicibacterium septicum DSM 44393]
MAVRPLVTTGVALVSAGAIVAGAPALFVPHSAVTVASPTAAAVEAHKTLTQEQIHLLALSLQGAWQSFTQGYGGLYIPGQVPTSAYINGPDGPIPVPPGTDPATPLVDSEGNQLYVFDPTGNPVPATAANIGADGSHPPFVDAEGEPVLEDAPGDCTATGAVCKDGFTGLAYYLSDNILPLGPIDNIFFEGGFTALAHEAIRTVTMLIDEADPTGRLDLTKRVDDFFEGGATQLVGNLLLDNLPQDGYAYGLTNSFFFGYGANTGITAAITYIVDAIAQQDPTPDPNFLNPLDGNPVQTFDTSSEDTMLLAKTTAEPETTTPTSTGLPNFGKLLSLPTPKLDVESPWQKLKATLDAPNAPTLLKDVEVKEQGTVEEEGTVEGGTEGTPVVEETKPEPLKIATPKFELPKIEAPKLEAPKLPEAPKFEAPKLDPPKLDLDLKPKAQVKEVATQDESKGEDKTGTDTKTGNKVTPPILFGDGKPKGESNGSKFLKKLGEAVKNATGGEKDSGEGSDK